MENNVNENSESGGFGMTQEEVKNYQVRNFFGRVKYYLALLEPALVKIFNALIYSLIKFLKAFVGGMIKMILGKEV
ncbi:MAG: hypothetical protein A2776_01825 [Candidatus Levybacteria bacterium RIFCSPHIGHO2_01_FULL_40_10]|nr:MAG: hypothetical protein A2776_01825 [Candidatus Levybacteria bacterium RIFCSPHIGHO2_01_FULL_40_10]